MDFCVSEVRQSFACSSTFSHGEVITGFGNYLRRSDAAINTFERVMVRRPIWCSNITTSVWYRYSSNEM